MACCFHFSNPLPQEGARFAKWRNVLQMDPAKGSLRIGTPRNFPCGLIWLVVWIIFLFSHIGKNYPKWLINIFQRASNHQAADVSWWFFGGYTSWFWGITMTSDGDTYHTMAVVAILLDPSLRQTHSNNLKFFRLYEASTGVWLSHETSICFKHHQPQWCLGRSDVPVRHGLPQPRSMNG